MVESIKKLLTFFVYGRFYISTAACALAIQSSLLFLKDIPSWSLCAFIFLATLFAYNIYYIHENKPVYPYHKITALIALGLATMALLFCWQDIHWGVFILVSILGSIYTFSSYLPFRLFSHPLIKISILTCVWTLAVVYLPLGKNLAFGQSFTSYVLHQFIFILMLNLLFDIKDQRIDQENNTRSIATKYGETTSYFLLNILEVVLILILYFMMIRSGKKLIPYVIPMLIGNIVLAFIIRRTRNNRSLFNFLLYVDGLLLLQSFLVILTYIAIRYE